MRIGIDLGGTKIEAIALAEDGSELQRQRVATPQGDYMATVMAMVALVEDIENTLHQRGSVGVGIPGTESLQTGLVINANSTCLIGKPLRRDLQALLQRDVRLANDANCFALSEASDGAGLIDGKPARVVFGVILGTGVGGGIVVDGNVLSGTQGIAGEWGHNPLHPLDSDEPGRPCYCGRTGCVETWLSGPAMVADHQRHSGIVSTPANIAKAAAAGALQAEATMQRYEQRLAQALAVIINILDPDVIVLGGGLSNLQRLYQNVPRYWGQHVFSDQVRTLLKPNLHGDSSGVRGAAWLWPCS
jgi:fructokinase